MPPALSGETVCEIRKHLGDRGRCLVQLDRNLLVPVLDCEACDGSVAQTSASHGDAASLPLTNDRPDLDESDVVNCERVCRTPEDLERPNPDPHPIATTAQP
jgi:hypothetical protein